MVGHFTHLGIIRGIKIKIIIYFTNILGSVLIEGLRLLKNKEIINLDNCKFIFIRGFCKEYLMYINKYKKINIKEPLHLLFTEISDRNEN